VTEFFIVKINAFICHIFYLYLVNNEMLSLSMYFCYVFSMRRVDFFTSVLSFLTFFFSFIFLLLVSLMFTITSMFNSVDFSVPLTDFQLSLE